MKRRIFLGLCGLAAGLISGACNLNAADAEPACRAVTDRFMQVWCGAPTNGAFKDVLKEVWYKPDEIDQVAKQTETQQERGANFAKDEGKRLAIPCEYLGSRQMGDNHLKLVYAEQLEQTTIPWSFLFYRAATNWHMVGILKGEGARDDLMAMGSEGGPEMDKPRQLTDTFMKDLTAGQEESAFSNLVEKHWARPDQAAEMKQQITGLFRSRRALGQLTLGKPIPGGFECLAAKTIGKSLVKLVYLQKYEFGVLPIKAVFYRPQNDWTLYELTLGEGVSRDDLTSATTVHLAKP